MPVPLSALLRPTRCIVLISALGACSLSLATPTSAESAAPAASQPTPPPDSPTPAEPLPAPPSPAASAPEAQTQPTDAAETSTPVEGTDAPRTERRMDQIRERIETTLESWEDFLNDLLVDALGPNYERRYRSFGRRKMVDLGKRWTLSLDDRPTGRLNSTGVGIPAAGRPSQLWELNHDGRVNDFNAYHRRDGTGMENGGLLATTLGGGWTLMSSGRRLHDDTLDIHRTDVQAGLRYQTGGFWLEGFAHHAQLNDSAQRQPWTEHRPKANFAGVQASWEAAPGLAFSAQHQRAFKSEMAPGDERLADARTEVGLDWRPQGEWAGSRVYWREATELGLLASAGVDERTTYKRVIGGEIPEGSPDGMVYAQVRQRSLLDDRDSLLVAGWRHTMTPAERWTAQSLIESGIPLAGPNAVKSNIVDLRLQYSDFPKRVFATEVQAVRTPIRNSGFWSADYTQRLSLNTLFVARGSVRGVKPHVAGGVPVNSGEASVGLGWQEPQARAFSTFWRYTYLGREALVDGVTTPNVADRRARIVFGELNHQPSEKLNLLLRASRRWDRDDSIQGGEQRVSQLVLLRPTQQIAARWRWSVHYAHWNDSLYGVRRGYGTELSVQMKRKLVLALGYNIRGIDDGELAGDDRIGKGVTLRLFVPVEAALQHWLRAARGD